MKAVSHRRALFALCASSAAVVAGCGSQGGSDAAVASSSEPCPSYHSCDLLTAADINSVLHPSVTTGTPKDTNLTEHGATAYQGRCSYQNGTFTVLLGYSYCCGCSEASDPFGSGFAQAEMDAGLSETFVNGLGTWAYYSAFTSPMGANLAVNIEKPGSPAGNVFITVYVYSGSLDSLGTDPLTATTELAQAAVNRL
jgi:hypothetical protein